MDVIGIAPAPLLDHLNSNGIVALKDEIFHPADIELLILARADVLSLRRPNISLTVCRW